jgi:hypothetical protein
MIQGVMRHQLGNSSLNSYSKIQSKNKRNPSVHITTTQKKTTKEQRPVTRDDGANREPLTITAAGVNS